MTWDINGYSLEFDEDTHTYLVDGVIVPSVTQIVKKQFGKMYENVPPAVLKRASERGLAVHEAIETYCKTGEKVEMEELNGFIRLVEQNKITVLANEVPVLFVKERPLFAGRLDMYIEKQGANDGDFAIADIKTTYRLDNSYLGYQLNLYRVAFEQSYKMDITKLYGMHLRDKTAKLVEIPINDFLVREVLENE
jgi:hypothetical protein